MPRFKFTGGDQRPDLYGVLEPGDVLELTEAPDWGGWELAGKAEAFRAPTPQPEYVPVDAEPAPEIAVDTRTRPAPTDAPEEG